MQIMEHLQGGFTGTNDKYARGINIFLSFILMESFFL